MQLKAIMVKAIIEKRRAVLDTASPKHTVIPCLTRHLQNTRGHVVLDTVSPKHTVMPCLTRHLPDEEIAGQARNDEIFKHAAQSALRA